MSGDGTGVVAHAGSVAVRMLADRVGLTWHLSPALARRGFTPGHDRGRVLVDLATMVTGGGEAVADIDTLRHQVQVLGPVASPPTAWRALEELTPAALKRIAKARAKTRARVWGLIPGGVPASRVAGTALPADVMVLDVDATIVPVHSEKEGAAATFKGTFGYHPLAVWCENTQELLAGVLRPGSAGSNTTADHIAVLTEAIAQVPADKRRNLLVRADGAGASHGLLGWLTDLNTAPKHGRRGRTVEYSVGFAVTEAVPEAISLVPKTAWSVALDADGEVREHADVVEITDLLPATIRDAWPEQMRVITRREHPTPGRSCPCSKPNTGGGTKRSRPTPRLGRSPSSRPGTAPTPVSRNGSGSPRTPAWVGPLPRVRHQHRVVRGRRDRRGPDRVAAAARPARTPQGANRRRCGTGSCTSPPA
ncbi:MAG TPA: transposase [Dermatophilaceae bacterium]|nr:transposase [Dermatophilaceae bacterium]